MVRRGTGGRARDWSSRVGLRRKKALTSLAGLVCGRLVCVARRSTCERHQVRKRTDGKGVSLETDLLQPGLENKVMVRMDAAERTVCTNDCQHLARFCGVEANTTNVILAHVKWKHFMDPLLRARLARQVPHAIATNETDVQRAGAPQCISCRWHAFGADAQGDDAVLGCGRRESVVEV